MKYKNIHGIISFSYQGKDYISNEGDVIDIPEEKGKRLEQKGYIIKQKTNKK